MCFLCTQIIKQTVVRLHLKAVSAVASRGCSAASVHLLKPVFIDPSQMLRFLVYKIQEVEKHKD